MLMLARKVLIISNSRPMSVMIQTLRKADKPDTTMATNTLYKDKAYVNGAWVSAVSGATFPVFNPSTGEVLGSVPDMGADDTAMAVQAASQAYKSWKTTTAKERSTLLKQLHKLMMENKDELAKMITSENGKPLSEAAGEIVYGASFCEWFAEEARRTTGDIIPSPTPSKRLLIIKQPVGVCGMITPWNFPNAMITRKACAALAAGCTVVLKPSEETPLSALAMCELTEQAGFPAGVFNVVTCARDNASPVGKVLCESPLVSLISFTGSSAIGKIVLRQTADTVKKCCMELGGNAPFLVFDSADVDQAVRGAINSKFRSTGQTCVCANRFLVQEGIYDTFVAKLAAAMDTDLKLGDGMCKGINQGPLINRTAVDRMVNFVRDAVKLGAKVVYGGSRTSHGENYFEPTLLKDVTMNMLCAKEEIFGPLAGIMKFKTEEEALRVANDVSAGLAGYVFTQDLSQMWRVAEALEYGMVGVNEGLFAAAETPHGGIKESGLGREGGTYGIEEYLEAKFMCIGGL